MFPNKWLSVGQGENLLSWARLSIVAAVLLLSIVYAHQASERNLLLVIAFLGILVLLKRPQLGLLGLLAGSLVIPFSIGTGTLSQINVAMMLVPILLVVWIAEMFVSGRIQLAPSRTTLPLFAFSVSVTISLIAGWTPWSLFATTAPLTAQIGGWAIFIFSFGAFLLVGNQINDLRWLKALVVLFLAIGALYMAGRVLPGFSSLSAMMRQMGSEGSMLWVWVVALASGQLLFNRKLNLVLQCALGLLVFGTLGIAWFQARSWTSGWLPPLVVGGLILWLRSWRWGLLATFAATVLVMLTNPDLLSSLIGVKEYSIMTRDVARQILLEQVFPLSPILGLGPANYYWYTPLFPILGYYVSFNSHNNYLDILMQTGIVGFVTFLWLVFEIGRLGWRLRKYYSDGFASGYVNACLAGLGGTLAASWLADWFLPFVYNIGLNGFRASIVAWIFLGGLVSLEGMARHSQTADTD